MKERREIDPQVVVDTVDTALTMLGTVDNNLGHVADVSKLTGSQVASDVPAVVNEVGADVQAAASHVEAVVEPLTPAHAGLSEVRSVDSDK
ncbi:MAG: hypothetical protein F4X98_19935 [Gammaproteobacteria bacterium]|nr:hypothetical protein [Gammaproteobacteria bacterium]